MDDTWSTMGLKTGVCLSMRGHLLTHTKISLFFLSTMRYRTQDGGMKDRLISFYNLLGVEFEIPKEVCQC
jgi:hypothetical protein